MDLASIDTVKGANAGAEVKLYHPSTNEDIGITIRVLGKDSDVSIHTPTRGATVYS